MVQLRAGVMLSLAILASAAVSVRAQLPEEKGTLLVLGYDDSQLPSSFDGATVVVRREQVEVARLTVVGGWPEGLRPHEVARRFGDIGKDVGQGKLVRVILPSLPDAKPDDRLDVEILVERAPALGAEIGLPGLDRLKTTPRRLPPYIPPGGTVQIFLGPLVQEISINVVHVAAPTFTPPAHQAFPFFTLHHKQRNEVHPLRPFQGTEPSYSSMFPQPDGSWKLFFIGPGSFYIGAYGFGYGEVKSTGLVIKPDDIDHTTTLEVESIVMEPLVWAILTFDLVSAAPVERCLDVTLSFQPQLFGKDPTRPREHLEEIKLRPVLALRPTHRTWLVGQDERPAPENAPFGLTGASWTVAKETAEALLAARKVGIEQTATILPGHCIENGQPVAGRAHTHSARLTRILTTSPENREALIFTGTPTALRDFTMLVTGRAQAFGHLAPGGDLSDWTLDHGLLGKHDQPALSVDVSVADVKLQPFCVTTLTVTVDFEGATPKEQAKGTLSIGEPLEIPPMERELAVKGATLERSLQLPPSLEPSTERVTLEFDQPVDPRTVLLDIGPEDFRPPVAPVIEGDGSERVTVLYQMTRLPERAHRTLRLRAGVQPANRMILPLQTGKTWRIEGDKLVEE